MIKSHEKVRVIYRQPDQRTPRIRRQALEDYVPFPAPLESNSEEESVTRVINVTAKQTCGGIY